MRVNHGDLTALLTCRATRATDFARQTLIAGSRGCGPDASRRSTDAAPVGDLAGSGTASPSGCRGSSTPSRTRSAAMRAFRRARRTVRDLQRDARCRARAGSRRRTPSAPVLSATGSVAARISIGAGAAFAGHQHRDGRSSPATSRAAALLARIAPRARAPAKNAIARAMPCIVVAKFGAEQPSMPKPGLASPVTSSKASQAGLLHRMVGLDIFRPAARCAGSASGTPHACPSNCCATGTASRPRRIMSQR